MSVFIPPYGGLSGLSPSSAELIDIEHFVEINEDTTYHGYSTSEHLPDVYKYSNTNGVSKSTPVRLYGEWNSWISSADASIYHGWPHEFYFEANEPTMIYLPDQYARFGVYNFYETTPNTASRSLNACHTYKIGKPTIFLDGVKQPVYNSDSIGSYGNLPPSSVRAALGDSPGTSGSNISIESRSDENSINVYGSSGLDGKNDIYSGTTSSTNQRIFFSSVAQQSYNPAQYNSTGFPFWFPAAGNNFFNPCLFFTKSCLIRFDLTASLNAPRLDRSSTVSSYLYRVDGIECGLRGYKVKF